MNMKRQSDNGLPLSGLRLWPNVCTPIAHDLATCGELKLLAEGP